MSMQDQRSIIRTDMHIHTCASDGTWTIQELFSRLRETGISLFSITDHDTIDSSRAALARPYPDLKCVSGVEISCLLNDFEYHITAYGFNPDSRTLNSLLKHNLCKREEWLENSISWISSHKSASVSLADYLGYKNNRTRGGCSAINYLLDCKAIHSPDDFFAIAKEYGEMPALADPLSVIHAVKSAGGFAFLAHPSGYARAQMAETDLRQWKNMGISGIECFHPSNKKESESRFYAEFCARNNLMISGGSDTHGEFVPSRCLGKPEIYLHELHLPFLEQAP